jgi:SAM-dependent methyltransferase
MNEQDAIQRNLANWQKRTPIHLRSEMYRRDIETLRAGGTTLLPPTDTEIGDVTGLRILHLQCHIGLDTLSLARLGAEVTGLDFSSAALQAGRELAHQLGLDVRWIEADAQRADAALAGQTFDLVFASFGVFCWIPDVRRWMASAANLLAPGGAVYVADGHPVMDLFEDDPDKPYGIDLAYSYFHRGATVFAPSPTYADDGTGAVMPESVEFTHTLGELVTAATDADLEIEFLHEFPRCFFRRCRSMDEIKPGVWDFPPPLAGKLPMVFSLRASKPERG